jgi:prepilin-type N-terminal cleavage/methylation domain-containing protein
MQIGGRRTIRHDRRAQTVMLAIPPFHSNDRSGFTLIEIISVLVLLSVLASIAIPKFIDLDANAKTHALDSGLSELNGREILVWSNIKISSEGFLSDAQVFNAASYDLGDDYDWVDGPTSGAGGGGTLRFQKSRSLEMVRTVAEFDRPAVWSRR